MGEAQETGGDYGAPFGIEAFAGGDAVGVIACRQTGVGAVRWATGAARGVSDGFGRARAVDGKLRLKRGRGRG